MTATEEATVKAALAQVGAALKPATRFALAGDRLFVRLGDEWYESVG